MPYYETVFICRQEYSTKQVDQLVEKLCGIVRDNGGTVHKTENWGLRTLAFKIKKNKKGHYALIETDTPPAALHEMERILRNDEDILRFMSVRNERLSTGPSVMKGGGRDENDEKDKEVA
jgi:small subunit ribosomal protein S6